MLLLIQILNISFWQASVFLELNLRVAQRAMLELEILELLVECFVLADFAHVEFLFKDAHATCDAWGEVAAALLATDIKFIDVVVALWTIKLCLLLVMRWIS